MTSWIPIHLIWECPVRPCCLELGRFHPKNNPGTTSEGVARCSPPLLSRRGLPMILREVEDGKAKPYSFSGMQKIVQRMRKEIGLPVEFTLDACRHGGMTELDESDLTDGQGRALSAHRTHQSYAGYAKRTEVRRLSATRKRHAHRLANQLATSVQNEPVDAIQNENSGNARSA